MASLIVTGLVSPVETDPSLYQVTKENKDLNLQNGETLIDIFTTLQEKPSAIVSKSTKAVIPPFIAGIFELIENPTESHYASIAEISKTAMFQPGNGLEAPFLADVVVATDTSAANSIQIKNNLEEVVSILQNSAGSAVADILTDQVVPLLQSIQLSLNNIQTNTFTTLTKQEEMLGFLAKNLTVEFPHAYHHSTSDTYLAMDSKPMTISQFLTRALFNPVRTYTDAVHTDYTFIPFLQTLALTRPTATGSIAKLPATNISNAYGGGDLLMNNLFEEPIFNLMADPSVTHYDDGASNDAVYMKSKN